MYSINDFKDRYTELEHWAETKYGKDGLSYIEDRHRDGKLRVEMRFFRHVRNIVTHTPFDDEPLLQLTDEFRQRFERICDRLMGNAARIAIRYNDVYKRQMGDKVLPTIDFMRQRGYSYVPVMHGRKVLGVFSETAIFNLVGDGRKDLISADTQLSKISDYITQYDNAGFFDFVDDEVSVDDIRSLFADANDHNRRLDVLYVTTNGNQEGDLVGMITVWDVTDL